MVICLQAADSWIWGAFADYPALEFVWSFFPILILLAIGIPGLLVLYGHETEGVGRLTVKVTGHQWYWRYRLADFSVEYDRFLIPFSDLRLGGRRLLEVDYPLVMPVSVECRVLITSADVLHSWAIPAMGLKADATPGRLNAISVFTHQVGIFYGQCREICGVNHSFMPVAVEVSAGSLFVVWLRTLI